MPVKNRRKRFFCRSIANRQSPIANAFTLVEIMVVVALLGLIVFALMAVFSSTQKAFRASITQSDILESGRATMELMTADVRGMTPSGGASNSINGAMNFFVTNNSALYQPLTNLLVGSNSGAQRTNLLQWFFILGRQNTSWTGTGYIVNSSSANPLYPLYRFSAQTNIENNPRTLFNLFTTEVLNGAFTNMSHLVDGVVGLTVRAYDTNGIWMTNGYANLTNRPANIWFSPPEWGEVGFSMFSNSLPATVQIEMATLEDRTLQRADSLTTGQAPSANPSSAQWQYLVNAGGKVHVFRQRISVPQVDISAYQ